MKYFAFLFAALLSWGAAAQQMPSPRGEYIYYPSDYGAKCDANADTGGGTDDTTALNAMFNAIRTAAQPFRVASGGKTCRITGPINVTNLRQIGDQNRSPSTIELRLYCATSGAPCVDALNTRFIFWDHLFIRASPTSSGTSPSVGIQFGRNSTLGNADGNVFNAPYIGGWFTKTGVYNFSAEQTTVISAYIWNDAVGTGTFGWMEDGCNTSGGTSTVATGMSSSFTTVAPSNTCQSSTFDTFIGGWFRGDVPIFLSGMTGTKFIASYGVSGGNVCGMRIYANGTDFNSTPRGLELDFSFEVNPDYQYCLGSSTASMRFFWLKVSSFIVQSPVGIFKTDPGVTSVKVDGFDIRLGQVPPGAKLFSSPPVWSITGLNAFTPGDMLYNEQVTPPSTYLASASGRICRSDPGVDDTFSRCYDISRGPGINQVQAWGTGIRPAGASGKYQIDVGAWNPITFMEQRVDTNPSYSCISFLDGTCLATDNYILSGRADDLRTAYNVPTSGSHEFRVNQTNRLSITAKGLELALNGPLLRYTQPLTLATLNTQVGGCTFANYGAVSMIIDALSPTWHGVATGGGSVHSMVQCECTAAPCGAGSTYRWVTF